MTLYTAREQSDLLYDTSLKKDTEVLIQLLLTLSHTFNENFKIYSTFYSIFIIFRLIDETKICRVHVYLFPSQNSVLTLKDRGRTVFVHVLKSIQYPNKTPPLFFSIRFRENSFLGPRRGEVNGLGHGAGVENPGKV